MDSIVIRLETNGLNAFLNDDKTVSLYPSDSETAVFHMSAPYMYDTAGAVCHEIDVSLARVEDEYLISYTPDREWLEDESRVYPVVIDPTVSTSTDTSNIDDTYVHPGDYAGQHYGETSFKVGNYQGKLNRAFLRFLHYPLEVDENNIIEAWLTLKMVSGTTTANPISILEVYSAWQPGTITWNSHLNMSRKYIGHTSPVGTSHYSFWVNDLYLNAINGQNTGFMFCYLDEGINDWNQLYSGNYNGGSVPGLLRPSITITYKASSSASVGFSTNTKLTGGVRGRRYYVGMTAEDFASDIQYAINGWSQDNTISFSRTSVSTQSVMDIYFMERSPSMDQARAYTLYFNTSKQEVPNNSEGDPLYDWYYCQIWINKSAAEVLVPNTSTSRATIAHEMGHVFGLDENNDNPYSIMCQYGHGRLTNNVQDCDRNGVKRIYGL